MNSSIETLEVSLLGEYIEKKRLEKDWSYRDLAEKAGVSFATIQDIEKGITKNPGIKAVVGIAKALGVHPMALIYAFEGRDPDTLTKEEKTALDDDLVEAFREFLSERRKHP